MSTIDDLRAEVINNLQVSSSTIPETGPTIDVNEKFKAQFTVRNNDKFLTFKNVKLKVSGTPDATPVGASVLNLDITAELKPGQSATSAQVEFIALANEDYIGQNPLTGKPMKITVREKFATLNVSGDADTAGLLSGLQGSGGEARVDIKG